MEGIFRTPRARKIALCVFIAAMSAFFGWNLLLKPQGARLAAIKKARAEQTERTKIASRIAAAEQKALSYKKYFSPAADSSGLIDTVNRTAGELGISLLSVVPQESGQDVDAYRKIGLRLETRCGFHALGEFVSRLESAPFFIKVTWISIQVEQSGEPSITMSMHAIYPAGAV